MVRGRRGVGSSTTGDGLATVARLATRSGAALAASSALLALLTFVAVLLDAPTYAVGLDAAVTGTTGPLPAGGGGTVWFLHAAVLGLLAGCWLLGAGLILSGLTD